jgi:ABC-type Mn2+/Zn2+ transport system ATPase subunit
VLRDIDFEVPAGTSIAITGANGGGKAVCFL